MKHIRHAVSLAFFLFAVWLLLSGHYTPLLVGLGLLSTIIVVAIAYRAELIDEEIHPVLINPSVMLYWMWLGKEIIRSSIDVTRRILDPGLPINPTLVKVKATQRTELGLVTYANSITLVPGTVAMEIEGNDITVHALTREAAAELKRGDMDRRVRGLERGFNA